MTTQNLDTQIRAWSLSMMEANNEDKDFTNGHGVLFIEKDSEGSERTQATQKADPEYDTPKAPDGGYGWFIVLGSFLSHLITGGFERSDGVFYIQFLSQFNKSAQLTAWPGAIVSTLRLCLSPLASAFSTRYSVRSSAILGAVCVSSGFILTSFAPNFYFIFFSHALLRGFGRGLSYAPGLTIVGMYFNKRRGVALGISCAGVGTGTFLIVPMTQFLFDTYGFRGAFLIIGGFSLNLLVVAMLFRPLSMHHRFTQATKILQLQRKAQEEMQTLYCPANQFKQSTLVSHDSTSTHLDSKSTSLHKNELTEPKYLDLRKDGNFIREKSDNCFKSALRILFPVEETSNKEQKRTKLFNFELLKSTAFLFYCISIWLFTLAFKAAFTFLPALMISRGISETDAALALSITGIVDTAGRVILGLVMDRNFIRPHKVKLYNAYVFVLAAVALILPSLRTFWSFVVVTSAYSLFSGAYNSQKLTIVVEILGVENMSSSFGLLMCFQGLGNLLGPPISGALKDYFGSYDQAFYLGGGCMVLAAFLMVLSNICLKIQRKREKSDRHVAIIT